MKIDRITQRKRRPIPFVETGKLPWQDPAFSARALREHLDQSTDSASRSEDTILAQIPFIVEQLRLDKGSVVLDLTCGPGLYARHLASICRSVVGIDISPAAIDYARRCCIPRSTFILGDVRTAPLPYPSDAALMIYGELNMFPPEEAQSILDRVSSALRPGGRLLLEVSTPASISEEAMSTHGWWTSQGGDIWSDSPYLALKECIYYPDDCIEVTRYYIIPEADGTVEEYTETRVAYTSRDIERMLTSAGFSLVGTYSSLTGDAPTPYGYFMVIVAQKS